MFNKGADRLGRVAHSPVEQVCVSLGGLYLSMSEKLTDEGERRSG